ncbi:MAG: chloride channel protein [Gammaproteobacteria bacterium]
MSANTINIKSSAKLYRMLVVASIGLVVGTISSFATIGFIEIVHWLNQILFITAESRSGLQSSTLTIATILIPTIGGLVVGLILRYGVAGGNPLGPPDSINAVQLRDKLPDPKSGFFSTLAAILSLGCGAPVGQYGPLVYMGTMVGQMANRLQLGVRDIRSTAIACGVAAAIATGFSAPIAGLIFTHEVILRHYSLRIFTAVTVASACGFIVANVVFEYPPLFLFEFAHEYHASEFFLFILEGLACGLLAIIFMKLLKTVRDFAAKLTIPAPCKPMIAGFILGLVALQIPEVLGAGIDLLHLASIPGIFSAEELATILLFKFLVTVLCIGFGFAGGVIFPALLIGMLFGSLFAVLVPELMLDNYSDLSIYAICGMVALASPVIGAPMTAMMIIFELTRSYEITIAAMVTVAFSNLTAYHWYGRSLFDKQLAERGVDLSLGRDRAYLQHAKVVNYASQVLPCFDGGISCGEAIEKLQSNPIQTAVVVDIDEIYLGLLHQDQLNEYDSSTTISSIKFVQSPEFDESTSLWSAMEIMRNYIGEAVPVIDSRTRRYLGAVPESEVIGTFLDAIHDLRREEHEA